MILSTLLHFFILSALNLSVLGSVFDLNPAKLEIKNILGNQYHVVTFKNTPTDNSYKANQGSASHRPQDPLFKTLSRELRPCTAIMEYYKSEFYRQGRDQRSSTEMSKHSSIPTSRGTKRQISDLNSEPEVLDVSHQQDDMSKLYQYIDDEILSYNFRVNSQEKKDQLRKTLLFILNDDYQGFLADKPNFLEVFCKNNCSIRKGFRHDMIPYYAVRFGASSFLTSSRSKLNRLDLNFGEALVMLVNTRPLSYLFKIMSSSFHAFIERKQFDEMKAAVQEQYPDLHFLDFLAIDMFCISRDEATIAISIINAQSENLKLSALTKLLNYQRTQVIIESFDFTRLNQISLKYPQYFSALNPETQFYLGLCAIVSNNTLAFESMISLAPNMLLIRNNIETRSVPIDSFYPTLFHAAVHFNKIDFIPLFMDLVPELVTFNENDKSNSPLDWAIHRKKFDILDAFYSYGFDPYAVKHSNAIFEDINSLQYCFFWSKTESFKYFLSKVGKQRALDDLFKLFGSKAAILKYTIKVTPPDIMAHMRLSNVLISEFDFDINSLI